METICQTGFDDDDDGTICLQCGDKGFTNAFVFCVKCLGFAVHRYCLEVFPETFDEFVRWICDDCEAKAQNLVVVPSQTMDFIVSNSTKQFPGVETKKNNLLVVQTVENGSEQLLYNDCTKVDCAEKASEDTLSQSGGKKDKADKRKRLCEDEKAEDNRMEHPKLSNGAPKKKKKKKRKIQESGTVKDQSKVVNNGGTNVECGETASEDTLVQFGEKKDKAYETKRYREDEKAEDNLMEHPKLPDGTLKKKKKKRKIPESNTVKDQYNLVYNECTNVTCGEKASEDTLTQLGRKRDKSDERKRLHKSSPQQPEDEKAEDNLMHHPNSSENSPMKIKKKKRKLQEFDTEKEQCKLVNDDCTDVESQVSEDALIDLGGKKDKADDRKRCGQETSRQLPDERAEENVMECAKISDCSPTKKEKNKRRNRELDTEKDQCKLDNNDSRKVECGEDTITQSGGKKDKADEREKLQKNSSQQPEVEKAEDNLMAHAKSSDGSPNKIKKKKRKIQELDVEKDLCKLANDDCIKDEKAKDNLIDHAKLSEGEKKKEKRKSKESDMMKGQCRLVNKSSKRSVEERVKVDITEPARLASDSISPSKVKENNCNPNISSKGALESVKKKKKIVESSEATVKEQMQRSVSPRPLTENNSENQCLGDGEKKTSAPVHDKIDILKDPHPTSAAPLSKPIWWGSFKILNQERDILDGLVAHPSSKACEKVYNEVDNFKEVLHLEIVPKTDVWPKKFEESDPTGDNIALYFFPTKISERDFDILVEEMKHKNLALKAFVQNAALLIFHSTELPQLYWRFQDKNYLWGVFRAKQSTPPHSHPFQEEVKGNPVIHTDVKDDTALSVDKVPPATKNCGAVSPCSPLINSASCC